MSRNIENDFYYCTARLQFCCLEKMAYARISFRVNETNPNVQ